MVNNFEQRTQALGRRINTLCSHLKAFLSKNLDQNMHKNASFFE